MIFMRIPLWLPVLMLLLGVAWPANDLGFPLDRALLQPLVPCGAQFFFSMSDSLFDTNPVGENLEGFFSNIWRLSPDQIAQLSPEGLVYAFRLAEIVYTAIRYEDSGEFDSNLRYWLARYHFAAHAHHVDILLDGFEEEVKNGFLHSF